MPPAASSSPPPPTLRWKGRRRRWPRSGSRWVAGWAGWAGWAGCIGSAGMWLGQIAVCLADACLSELCAAPQAGVLPSAPKTRLQNPPSTPMYPLTPPRQATLVLVADQPTLRDALADLTASPLESVELEADDVLFADASGASHASSRCVVGCGGGAGAGVGRRGDSSLHTPPAAWLNPKPCARGCMLF